MIRWVSSVYFLSLWILLGTFVPALPAQADTASALGRQIEQSRLDPDECYRVSDLNFSKEDLKIYLTSGYLIFPKPVAGTRFGAIFVAAGEGADAEVLLRPPTRAERASLANFTGSPNLDQHFQVATLVFTDGTADELLNQIHAAGSNKSLEYGNLLAENYSSVLENLADSFETKLVDSLLAPAKESGFFYMGISVNNQHNFDILYDPTRREQILVGALAYRNDRTYFDTWTSFLSRSARNGAALPGLPTRFDNYRIDATVDGNLALRCVTRATLSVQQSTRPDVFVNLTTRMHVTAASIDGVPAEVFDHDSLRSNLIGGNDERGVLIVADHALDPSKSHEIEIHHEGEVIQQSGGGVFFINSRNTWYPRADMGFANYDLTFHFPKDLTLASTGTIVEESTEGEQRTTRRKTDIPIRFAGFNLGHFQESSVSENGFKLDVYANRTVEQALRPRPIAIVPTFPTMPNPRPGRGGLTRPNPEMDTVSDPIIPVIDPSNRIGQLTHDVSDALNYMTSLFGPPPFRSLSITPIPGAFGQGFPGLIYLSTLAYLDPAQRPPQMRGEFEQMFYSELLANHEIAHQWWGNMVVAAGYHDEWLLEALANYTSLMFLEKKRGAKAVDAVLDQYRRDLLTKTPAGHSIESAGPIIWGTRLESSLVPNGWRIVTYEKGTWIIHMLRRRMGDQNFLKFLKELAEQYRLNSLTTEQFRAAAAKYMPTKGPDSTLETFFENWVYGTGIPTVKLTYAWRGGKLSGTIAQQAVDDNFSALVPVEVQTAKQKQVLWLGTAGDSASFSVPLAAAPTRVAVLSSDCLVTAEK